MARTCATPSIAPRTTWIVFFEGANPAVMPVEQPIKFELAINLQTAKQIGVTTPTDVLVLADKVIE